MNDRFKGFLQLILVFVFISISVLASSLLHSSPKKEGKAVANERSVYVEAEKIKSEPYRIEFDVTGVVQARAEIAVTPQLSGRVIEINPNFFEGGMFKADEVLFKVEPLDFELEVQRLDAQVASARKTLDVEKVESRAATEEWRMVNGKKAVPALVARKPQMDEARANLKAAEAQLKNAQLDLERTSFSLPFDGRVLSSSLELGQFVSSGQSYGQVFDLSGLEVRASLEDRQLEWLMDGEDPEITISAEYLGKKKTYKGTLKRAASALDPQTRFAAVNFGFEDDAPDLLPGVFATISVKGRSVEGVTKIPASALQKNQTIWVLNEDNTLRAVEPDILFSSKNYIAIRNFNNDQPVVISRVSGGTDGMKVIVNDEDNPSDQPQEQEAGREL